MNGRHCWYVEENGTGECEAGCARWPKTEGCAFLSEPCPWNDIASNTGCAYDADSGASAIRHDVMTELVECYGEGDATDWPYLNDLADLIIRMIARHAGTAVSA